MSEISMIPKTLLEQHTSQILAKVQELLEGIMCHKIKITHSPLFSCLLINQMNRTSSLLRKLLPNLSLRSKQLELHQSTRPKFKTSFNQPTATSFLKAIVSIQAEIQQLLKAQLFENLRSVMSKTHIYRVLLKSTNKREKKRCR